jgi:OOP family OmpA-OmpF porin
MKTSHCITAFALLAAMASGAGAQPFVGASVGHGRVDLDCAGTTRCDKSDTVLKLFGGYMFSPNFGLEGAYYDQGRLRQEASDVEFGDVSVDWRGRAVAAYGLAAYSLDNVSFFAKLGLARTRVKVSASASLLGSAEESESHTGAAWGLGVAYQLGRNVGARLEYERLRLRFMEEKQHASVFSLGLQYRF